MRPTATATDRKDIWGSVPDALASVANFLRQQGWRPGQPWGFEVRLPPGFDYAVGRGSFAQWRTRGLVRADGNGLPPAGEAALFFPAGAKGPAFLVTGQFRGLKDLQFFRTPMHLSIGEVADQMTGGAASQAAWPSDLPLGRDDRIALQARLAALGYPVDNRDGRISLALRDVIRTAQASVGLLPDGNPTPALLQALGSAPPAR